MEQATIAGVQDSRRAVKSCSESPRGKMRWKGSVGGKGVYAPRCQGPKRNSGLKITSQEWVAGKELFNSHACLL